MNPFALGFVVAFAILLLILVILRLSLPNASKLFAPRPIPYKSVEESTEWLNFVLYRVMTHFQTEDAIEKISKKVTDKINPHKFKLLSLGNAPTIEHVGTLQMKEPDDIRILVPVDWQGGPSFDLTIGRGRKKIKVEFDLTKFFGKVLMSWPGDSDSSVEIRFDSEFTLDFEVVVQLGPFIRVPVTQLPLLGEIVKGIVAILASRQVIVIDLPKPQMKPAEE